MPLLRTLCLLISLVLAAGAAQARITRIVIDETVVEPRAGQRRAATNRL